MIRVVFNQKGGVGKSTITSNLASVGAARGRRTLVVDLDSQANSTRYLLGAEASGGLAESTGVAGFFDQSLKLSLREGAEEFIVASPFENLDVLPASARLDELLPKLESRYKIYKLRKGLEALRETYRDIWIDTPPTLNFYTRSALMAAKGCLIPFDCDDFARRSLYALLDEVEDLRSEHNPDLRVLGIIVNQFQSRAKLPGEVVQELRDEGLPVLEPFLSSTIKVRESHQASRPMVHLERGHKLTQEFEELFDAVTRASPGRRAMKR